MLDPARDPVAPAVREGEVNMNPRALLHLARRAAIARQIALPLALLAVFATTAQGQVVVPSDGSDGSFSPVANTVVDLSLAPTGVWDEPGNGNGVYDPDKWAVVFKFSDVNIPSGVTVSFTNHPSGAPVVWLVQNTATINGTVNLNGTGDSRTGLISPAPPGGFRGGAGVIAQTPASGGFGPGGGIYYEGGGSYGTGSGAPTYGNEQILPLIGGSGGAGGDYFGNTRDSSSGGGAILVAAGGTATLNGTITANAGPTRDTGGGSGGGVRVICNELAGDTGGRISAVGSSGGGAGRIRVEANTVSFEGTYQPAPSVAEPAAPPQIWPAATAPTIRITEVGGVAAPADPHSAFEFPNQDVTLASQTAIPVRIAAQNMPTDWVVVLRVTPRNGQDFTANATLVSGNQTSSVWEAQINAPVGFSALQVRAYKPQP